MAELTIRDAEPPDVDALTAIQNAFIGSAAIEWTEVEYSVNDRRAWLESQQAARYPVLVAVMAGEVVGWASFGEFRDNTRWPGYIGSRSSTRFTFGTITGVGASDAS